MTYFLIPSKKVKKEIQICFYKKNIDNKDNIKKVISLIDNSLPIVIKMVIIKKENSKQIELSIHFSVLLSSLLASGYDSMIRKK